MRPPPRQGAQGRRRDAPTPVPRGGACASAHEGGDHGGRTVIERPLHRHAGERGLRFMPVAKPGGHAPPSGRSGAGGTGWTRERSERARGVTHRSGRDHMPPDDAGPGPEVNMVRYGGTDRKGNVRRFSRVTGPPASEGTPMEPMRCARRGRATGNGAFRTVKARDGYGFGHGFGHGKNRPPDLTGTFRMPAFPIDGTLSHGRGRVREAMACRKRRLHRRDRMRELPRTFVFPDRATFHLSMAGKPEREDYVGPVRAGP